VKILPEDFVVNKFYQFVGNPIKNKFANSYKGSCPMCREGNSWLKKQRFFYIPDKNLVYCHNCGYKKTPLSWISEITNQPVNEILEEINESTDAYDHFLVQEPKKLIVDTLPKDCINLFDENQIQYYKNHNIVKKAFEFLLNRRLINAVNRPKTFYLSLTDIVHKNRIIIPFFDDNGRILHYQSRSFLEKDLLEKPRYLSKINSEKTIFNIDKIDSNDEFIYIFEGPLNSCFVKNGVAIGGIQENSYQLYTNKQQEQINKFILHKKIWILDSQWKDKASLKKTKKLLELKENVFIWPKEIGKKYKDINDLVIAIKEDKVSPNFFKKYTK